MRGEERDKNLAIKLPRRNPSGRSRIRHRGNCPRSISNVRPFGTFPGKPRSPLWAPGPLAAPTERHHLSRRNQYRYSKILTAN